MANLKNILLVLIIINIISYLLIFLGTRVILSSVFPPIGLIGVLITSVVMFFFSIYGFIRDNRNWIIYVISLILSIIGVIIFAGIIIAIKTFT